MKREQGFVPRRRGGHLPFWGAIILYFGALSSLDLSASAQELCPGITGPRYARGFSFVRTPEGITLRVSLPVSQGKSRLKEWRLKEKRSSASRDPSILALPVTRVVALSTTVLPAFAELDREDALVGVQEGRWVQTPEIAERIRSGAVVSVGENWEPERILNLNPDLVLAYAVGDPYFDRYPILERLGIPVFLVQEFREESPLARAEWVKVLGCVLGRDHRAEDLFQRIAQAYEAKRRSPGTSAPRALLASHYQGVWYFSKIGGYLTTLLQDAGMRVIHPPRVAGKTVDREEVYRLGKEAEIWILLQFAPDVPKLLEPPLDSLPPVRTGRIYALKGGEFWERGVLHPEELLAELSAMVEYPGAVTELRYFTPVSLKPKSP